MADQEQPLVLEDGRRRQLEEDDLTTNTVVPAIGSTVTLGGSATTTVASPGPATVIGDAQFDGLLVVNWMPACGDITRYMILCAVDNGGISMVAPAMADWITDAYAMGVAATDSSDGDPCWYTTLGIVPVTFEAVPQVGDIGLPVYLSQTVWGAATLVPPNSGWSIRLGYLVEADGVALTCKIDFQIGDLIDLGSPVVPPFSYQLVVVDGWRDPNIAPGMLTTSERYDSALAAWTYLGGGSLVDNYVTGAGPYEVAADTLGQVWITNYDAGTVSAYDTTTHALVGTYPVGNGPQGVAVDALNQVWITNSGDNSVSVYDAASKTLFGTYVTGTAPGAVAVDDLGQVWIANLVASTVSVYLAAGRTLVNTISVTPSGVLQGLAVDGVGAGCTVWVTNRGGVIPPWHISVYNAATLALVATFTTTSAPYYVANDGFGYMWVTNRDDNTVSIFNAATHGLTLTLATGAAPFGVTVDALGQMWIANSGDNTVTVYDAVASIQLGVPGVLLGTYPVGTTPLGIAVEGTYEQVWISDNGSNHATVYNLVHAALPQNEHRVDANFITLGDGNLLLVGGQDNSGTYYNTAYHYDREQLSTEAPVPSTMANTRVFAAVCQLANGNVLVAGGKHGRSIHFCEEFDGATWSAVGNLPYNRQDSYPVLLSDGRVLLITGNDGGSVHNDCALYDPVLQTWATTGSYPYYGGEGAVGVLLNDGTVLGVGGWDGSTITTNCYRYSPLAGVWSTLVDSHANPIRCNVERRRSAICKMANGKILVAGGRPSYGPPLADVEVLDPSDLDDGWSAAASMNHGRMYPGFRLVPLTDGRVLAIGGEDAYATTVVAEIYDPNTDTWTDVTVPQTYRSGNIISAVSSVPTVDHIVMTYPWTPQDWVNDQRILPNPQFSIQIGGSSLQFGAVAFDQFNNPVTGVVTFNWSISSPADLSVDGTGLVSALAGSFGWVQASVGSVYSDLAYLNIVVDAVPISSDLISGFSLAIGDISYLNGYGVNGSVGHLYLEASYTNGDPGVARVDSDGIIHGLSAGTAHISTTVDGIPSSTVNWPVVASPDHFQIYDPAHAPLNNGDTLTIAPGFDYTIYVDAYDGDDNVIVPQLFCCFYGDNDAVVQVSHANSDGGLHAVAEGTAHLWVTAGTTISYQINILVSNGG